jgi:hypothetical protein
VTAAAAAVHQWNNRDADTDRTRAVAAGRATLDAIDRAAAVLDQARDRLAGQLRQDKNDRHRAVDAYLAESRGEKCLHAEDSRHQPAYGPPVPVGCGCPQPCCTAAEDTAAALGDPTHGDSGPGGIWSHRAAGR